MVSWVGSAVRTAALVGVVAFALTGCGGADDESGKSGANQPMGVLAEPVDVCALFTAEDFVSVLGKPVGEVKRQEAQGSLLGDCMYLSDGATATVHVSARPVREWDTSVEAYHGASVGGVGEKAAWTDQIGLLVLPAGKPYFLQVLVIPDTSNPTVFDKDLAVEVGKVAAT